MQEDVPRASYVGCTGRRRTPGGRPSRSCRLHQERHRMGRRIHCNRHAPVVSPLNTPSAAPIRTGHGQRASADAMAPPPKRHPFTLCPNTPAPGRRPRRPTLSPGNLPDRTVERAWRGPVQVGASSTECRSRSTTRPGPAGGAASDARCDRAPQARLHPGRPTDPKPALDMEAPSLTS